MLNGPTRTGAKCKVICQYLVLVHGPNRKKIREKMQYMESNVQHECNRGLLGCSDADLKLSLSGSSSYKLFSNKKKQSCSSMNRSSQD